MRDVIVLGSGGHAKVVISTLLAAGRRVRACYDDDAARHGMKVLGIPVAGLLREAPLDAEAVIGLGNNRTRRDVAEARPLNWTTAVHPTASVDPTARIGPGTVVFAGAILQPDVEVGPHAVINVAATVDHDGRVGAFSQIAAGAHLGGTVELGEGGFVGAGASVIENRVIGAWSTVGAGAVVIRDVPPDVTVVGVPADVR